MESPVGLRDRNKARARAEIAAAALELFAKNGFDAVTVDEIVAAAGVSRRTFFRYFETKEDALLADYPELTTALSESLVEPAQGDDNQPLSTVRAALHRLADWYEERSEAVLARSGVMRETVQLTARNLGFLSQWEKAIASTVAASLGTDPRSMLPGTAGAITVASFRVALTQWVRSSCQDDLHALIDRSLDVVETGLARELST